VVGKLGTQISEVGVFTDTKKKFVSKGDGFYADGRAHGSKKRAIKLGIAGYGCRLAMF
jgi:hypothetical protein